jgi:hypothetical protein
VLVLEDLSDADWTPRWTPARVDAVLAALDELASSPPPPRTPRTRTNFAEMWIRWDVVAHDPAPFLATRLRDAAWLARALPVITGSSPWRSTGSIATCCS